MKFDFTLFTVTVVKQFIAAISGVNLRNDFIKGKRFNQFAGAIGIKTYLVPFSS